MDSFRYLKKEDREWLEKAMLDDPFVHAVFVKSETMEEFWINLAKTMTEQRNLYLREITRISETGIVKGPSRGKARGILHG